jgi:hypothetical protein
MLATAEEGTPVFAGAGSAHHAIAGSSGGRSGEMHARMPKRKVIGILTGVVAAVALAACGGNAGAQPSAVVAGATSTPLPVATAVATPVATPTSRPTPDGYVTGTWTIHGSATESPTTGHSYVNLLGIDTNDERVNGDATWDAGETFKGGSDIPDAGYTWAIMTIKNDGGTWKGSCKGAKWVDSHHVITACELNGTGAYAGLGFYVQLRYAPEEDDATVEGVIYSGDIPEE